VKSLTGMRDVSAAIVAQKLTGHLVRKSWSAGPAADRWRRWPTS
jgi:hypothetical protein